MLVDVIIVGLVMDSQTSFLVEPFQLTFAGFHFVEYMFVCMYVHKNKLKIKLHVSKQKNTI